MPDGLERSIEAARHSINLSAETSPEGMSRDAIVSSLNYAKLFRRRNSGLAILAIGLVITAPFFAAVSAPTIQAATAFFAGLSWNSNKQTPLSLILEPARTPASDPRTSSFWAHLSRTERLDHAWIAGSRGIVVHGLSKSKRPFYLFALHQRVPRETVVVVFPDNATFVRTQDTSRGPRSTMYFKHEPDFVGQFKYLGRFELWFLGIAFPVNRPPKGFVYWSGQNGDVRMTVACAIPCSRPERQTILQEALTNPF
jgi:hypothetical protein